MSQGCNKFKKCQNILKVLPFMENANKNIWSTFQGSTITRLGLNTFFKSISNTFSEN